MTLTERLIEYLTAGGATFQVMHHEPVKTSEEAARVRGTPLESGAKALLYRADGNPVLLVLPADRRVDARAFKRAVGVKDLRMVSPDDLHALTGLEVGAVPPFGQLMGFPTYVDRRLLAQPRLSFNAGSRTTSVVLDTADYERLSGAVLGEFVADVAPG